MRMTGRWVRRGSTVVVLGVERERTFEGPFTFEVPDDEPADVACGASGSAVLDLQTRLKAAAR